MRLLPLMVLVCVLSLSGLHNPAPAAADFRPAILHEEDRPRPHAVDGGGFVDMALAGAHAFTTLTGQPVAEFPRSSPDAPAPQTPVQQAQRALAHGYTSLIGVGFSYKQAFAELAPRYPDVRFVLIDASVFGMNVQSVVFREHEGAYLMGVIAATASSRDHVGFVGGWDSPLIRRFACGFVQGARSVTPDVAIEMAMAGDDVSAFNDPEAGYRLARQQFEAGADVVFHAAGHTGAGVIRAAAEAEGRFAIGVDYNQNGEAPGHVLTSMLKRVDVAVFRSLKSLAGGTWTPGTHVLGLPVGGIGWALDEHNVHLFSDEIYRAIAEAEFAILVGDIVVNAYSTDSGCPGHTFAPAGTTP